MSTLILQLIVYTLNTHPSGFPSKPSIAFPSLSCSTSTEPGLVFQVHSVRKAYGLFLVQHLQIHAVEEQQDSLQALALLWMLTETLGLLYSCQAGLARTEQGTLCFTFSQCCCGVSTSSSSSSPCSVWRSSSSRSGLELASFCSFSAFSPACRQPV